MHSHLFENVEAWYLDFDYRGRVDTTFRPGFEAREGAQTLPQAPEDAASEADLKGDFSRTGAIGHSGSIQPTSRLQMDIKGADGETYAKGSAIRCARTSTRSTTRSSTSDPERDRHSEQPDAGLHFITFNPSSDDFAEPPRHGRRPAGRHRAATEARSRRRAEPAYSVRHRQNYPSHRAASQLPAGRASATRREGLPAAAAASSRRRPAVFAAADEVGAPSWVARETFGEGSA